MAEVKNTHFRDDVSSRVHARVRERVVVRRSQSDRSFSLFQRKIWQRIRGRMTTDVRKKKERLNPHRKFLGI